jgi:hypothetical protein
MENDARSQKMFRGSADFNFANNYSALFERKRDARSRCLAQNDPRHAVD